MPTIVVRKPIITEKSVAEASAKNIYLFEVNPGANKHQIGAEVERMYGVSVESVRTVMQPRKKKKAGKKRTVRLTARKKKAFVHVKAGQKIAVFDIAQS
ncbi:MAG: 50S ribosomal protein L23 [Patescibacteria group bacterium]